MMYFALAAALVATASGQFPGIPAFGPGMPATPGMPSAECMQKMQQCPTFSAASFTDKAACEKALTDYTSCLGACVPAGTEDTLKMACAAMGGLPGGLTPGMPAVPGMPSAECAATLSKCLPPSIDLTNPDILENPTKLADLCKTLGTFESCIGTQCLAEPTIKTQHQIIKTTCANIGGGGLVPPTGCDRSQEPTLFGACSTAFGPPKSAAECAIKLPAYKTCITTAFSTMGCPVNPAQVNAMDAVCAAFGPATPPAPGADCTLKLSQCVPTLFLEGDLDVLLKDPTKFSGICTNVSSIERCIGRQCLATLPDVAKGIPQVRTACATIRNKSPEELKCMATVERCMPQVRALTRIPASDFNKACESLKLAEQCFAADSDCIKFSPLLGKKQMMGCTECKSKIENAMGIMTTASGSADADLCTKLSEAKKAVGADCMRYTDFSDQETLCRLMNDNSCKDAFSQCSTQASDFSKMDMATTEKQAFCNGLEAVKTCFASKIEMPKLPDMPGVNLKLGMCLPDFGVYEGFCKQPDLNCVDKIGQCFNQVQCSDPCDCDLTKCLETSAPTCMSSLSFVMAAKKNSDICTKKPTPVVPMPGPGQIAGSIEKCKAPGSSDECSGLGKCNARGKCDCQANVFGYFCEINQAQLLEKIGEKEKEFDDFKKQLGCSAGQAICPLTGKCESTSACMPTTDLVSAADKCIKSAALGMIMCPSATGGFECNTIDACTKAMPKVWTPTRSCAPSQVRCADGSCADTADSCPKEGSPRCPSGKILCPDALNCAASSKECAKIMPFDGCPIGQFSCPGAFGEINCKPGKGDCAQIPKCADGKVLCGIKRDGKQTPDCRDFCMPGFLKDDKPVGPLSPVSKPAKTPALWDPIAAALNFTAMSQGDLPIFRMSGTKGSCKKTGADGGSVNFAIGPVADSEINFGAFSKLKDYLLSAAVEVVPDGILNLTEGIDIELPILDPSANADAATCKEQLKRSAVASYSSTMKDQGIETAVLEGSRCEQGDPMGVYTCVCKCKVFHFTAFAAVEVGASPNSQSQSESKKSGLSGGAIAGIIIGSLAGIALIVGAVFMLKGRERNARSRNHRDHNVDL